MEHHQDSQQDILGAVPPDRCGWLTFGCTPTTIEVYYKGHLVESMERIRGKAVRLA